MDQTIKKRNRIENFIYKLTLIFFIVFVLLFSIASIMQSSYMSCVGYDRHMVYENLFTIRSLIFFIVLFISFLLIKHFSRRISSKKVLIIEMLIFSIVGMYSCYLYVNVKPNIDSNILYETAQSMYYGNFSVIDSKTYIGECTQNLGLLSLYYLFIKLFNNSIFVLTYMRLLNLVFVIAAYVYLYRITNLLFNSNLTNLFLLLLFLGFNHFLLYTVFIYTNVIGYSLAIMSIYYLIYYLKTGKHIWISFISIVFSTSIRMNSLIILIAEIIVILIKVIKDKKWVNIIFVFLFSIGLLVPSTITKYYENKYNVIYNHQIPTIVYICHGMNYLDASPGRWISDFANIYHDSDYDKEPVKEYANIYLKHTLEYFRGNPDKCIKFYLEKYISGWLDPSYDVFTDNTYNEKNLIKNYEPVLRDIYDAFLSFMAIGLVLYLLLNIRNINYEFILILSVVGGFIFHFFWEMQAIYTYQYILLLLPLSAYGFKTVLNKIKI